MLPVGGPHLLAVDDEVVAVAGGSRAQPGQVTAGVGFAEQLAPNVFPGTDSREEVVLLLIGSRGDDRRCGKQAAADRAAAPTLISSSVTTDSCSGWASGSPP